MTPDIENCFKASIDANKIHGAVLCATDAKSHFVYNNALGKRTLLSGEKKPQRLDDILCLGLCTSLVTTVAVLQCVEDGLLSLLSDLSLVVPELATKEVITGFTNIKDGGDPLFEPADTPITLEMLLTHSSGVGYDFLQEHVGRWRRKFAPVNPDKLQTVEETYSYPLGFQPGAGWMFGPGLDWVGRIVERVTGQKLGYYIQQRIFTPLGISDAQFYPITREDLRSRQVDLNPEDQDGYGKAVLGGGGVSNKCSKGHFGGHGLFMTGLDFTKILHSLLANDGKLLTTATVDEMFQDHLSPDARADLHSTLSGPLGPFFKADPDVETKMGHGLGGLLTMEDIQSGYGKGTLCWGGAMSLLWFIDRKNDLCGFGAIQATLAPGGTASIPVLKDTFRKDIYALHAAWKKAQDLG
ncbi:uncharacterized protein TrAFT101_010772 [Trichoderma asperellum]|uniref:Beta-lactamase-related domain-containing protein n=1 Tax=Trichoderma asperellum (strain ATCC 204424 / CBS 433.97 / NBRC 101777) TaxID=1042311 RepID=A0A2T3YQ51_TRIA4|nr:hypothetical protein M441DRAFT_63233 [Trichoderma asperellum CBS 433.97]PTB34701.1 hypothetical protein M441DRAFT_63233 [Trichoderma asperellum CBS 433.97]UKZ95966.1 hypothetical protein TrAFT101_010772 [Trichoderma asperellum]